jgi:hypothetical protein
MAATAPTPAKDNSKAPADKGGADKAAGKGPGQKAPPEEKFWQRYSPHGELPISSTGSVAMHILVVGALLLFGAYFARLISGSNRSLPVEPVRLAIAGGGGSRTGAGDKAGIGLGPDDVRDAEQGPQAQQGQPEAPARPALKPVERQKLRDNLDDASYRYIRKADTDAARSWARLDDASRRRLSDGLNPGKGKGGRGKGGGSGSGSGTGEGSGSGPGKQATLSQREKRMLRWNMRFATNSGEDYLRQLHGLGAILAIPFGEGGDPQYKLVRDLLARPAKLLSEDVSKVQRIYWIDDEPGSVAEVMRVLGVNHRPNRFVAFMPQALEQRLFEMEHRHMKQKFGFFDEERIYETRFKVENRGGRYEPVLVSMQLKEKGA